MSMDSIYKWFPSIPSMNDKLYVVTQNIVCTLNYCLYIFVFSLTSHSYRSSYSRDQYNYTLPLITLTINTAICSSSDLNE